MVKKVSEFTGETESKADLSKIGYYTLVLILIVLIIIALDAATGGSLGL